MTLDARVGKDAKLYYNSGTYSTPTWNLIPRVIDLSTSLGKNLATLAARDSAWEFKGPALKTASLEIGYLHKPGADTIFDVFKDAYLNDTLVELLVLDQLVATSGAKGPRLHVIISGLDEDQPLEDGIKFSIRGEVAREDDDGTLREPTWHVVP